MKFILIVALVAADGLTPQAQMFNSLAECEATLKKVRALLARDTNVDYISACLRVRNAKEKEV